MKMKNGPDSLGFSSLSSCALKVRSISCHYRKIVREYSCMYAFLLVEMSQFLAFKKTEASRTNLQKMLVKVVNKFWFFVGVAKKLK